MGCQKDTLPTALILLLDNKDSFVWNLAQGMRALGARVEVVRSDAVDPEAAGDGRAIVLSPGPGRPDGAGACIDIVRRWSGLRPILGVCLGHQAIAAAFGAEIVRSEPCHGRSSTIQHPGSGLYRGLPPDVAFCRYHSLSVARETMPAELVAEAFTADGLVMGLRHREHPSYGVQFHPESFRSPHGQQLLRNFLDETV